MSWSAQLLNYSSAAHWTSPVAPTPTPDLSVSHVAAAAAAVTAQRRPTRRQRLIVARRQRRLDAAAEQ